MMLPMEPTTSTAVPTVLALTTTATPIRIGDIRRVEALAGLQAQPRAALVVRTIADSHDSSEIMLVHDRIEMAMPDDVILHPGGTLFEHGLVVQTRIRGVVWNLQVGKLLARLETHQMDAVASVASSRAPSSTNVITGKSIAGSEDERRSFQESELQELLNLSADYADSILDDDGPWRIDTDLVSPRLLELAENPSIILTEVMHLLRTRQVAATIDDLEALAESGVFVISAWKSTTYGNELASQIAIGVRALIECALTELEDTDRDDRNTRGSVRLPNRVIGARDLAAIPGTRLLSAPFLWSDGGARILADPLRSEDCDHDGLEVMMVATPDERDDIAEEGIDGSFASI